MGSTQAQGDALAYRSRASVRPWAALVLGTTFAGGSLSRLAQRAYSVGSSGWQVAHSGSSLDLGRLWPLSYPPIRLYRCDFHGAVLVVPSVAAGGRGCQTNADSGLLAQHPLCSLRAGDEEVIAHRMSFPDLLFVPEPCGGLGVLAMMRNRLEIAAA